MFDLCICTTAPPARRAAARCIFVCAVLCEVFADVVPGSLQPDYAALGDYLYRI